MNLPNIPASDAFFGIFGFKREPDNRQCVKCNGAINSGLLCPLCEKGVDTEGGKRG